MGGERTISCACTSSPDFLRNSRPSPPCAESPFILFLGPGSIDCCYDRHWYGCPQSALHARIRHEAVGLARALWCDGCSSRAVGLLRGTRPYTCCLVRYVTDFFKLDLPAILSCRRISLQVYRGYYRRVIYGRSLCTKREVFEYGGSAGDWLWRSSRCFDW